MNLPTYLDTITYLKSKNRTPHLLIGNGFSIAYDKDIFSYNALFQFIENLDDELLTKLFGIVKTKNFELVMQQLDNFCELIEAFSSDKELLNNVQQASEHLKHSLVDAIKQLHPEHVFTIPQEESQNCATFLSEYLNAGGQIFSTNYDILLYWVLMRNELQNAIDGFGKDTLSYDKQTEEVELSELYWGPNKNKQNVHYIHGALPIFDTGLEVIKETYTSEAYLLENIETRLNKGEYPVFVSSGDGDDKLKQIRHSPYLSHCYDALSSIEGSLITIGFNFGEYDDHIIQAINHASKYGIQSGNKLFSVYIGVFSERSKKHVESIRHKFKCKVNLFDATSANIWR